MTGRATKPVRDNIGSVVAVVALVAVLLTAAGCPGPADNNSAADGNPATGNGQGTPDHAAGNRAAGAGTWWRVRSKDGVESHILGYVHAGPTGAAEFPPALLEKLDSAGRVVLETAYPEDDAPAALTVKTLSELPERDTLEGLLPLPTWKQLLRRMDTRDPAQLARLRPWAAARVLRFSLLGVSLERGRPTTTEAWLQARVGNRASAASPDQPIELRALEPFLKLYTLLDEVPLHEWVAEIDFLARAGRAYRAHHEELVAAWQAGNLEAIAAHLAERTERMPVWTETVIRNRTVAWLSELPRHLDEGAFVIVNVFHLVGPDNLLDSLRDAGYTIDQMR